MDHRELREQNRRSWNAVVPAHSSHRADQVAFFRRGGSTLFPEELALLGEVHGLSIAHLMCNTGQDSLSLAARGAIVTGVDISDAAIEQARRLADEIPLPATFERADVYDWLAAAAQRGEQFDRVFCSYGAICWLPDLYSWARGVAAIVRPGGRFVLVEFHPVSNMFDRQWRLDRSYPAGGSALPIGGVGDYVGDSGGGLTPSGFVEGIRDFQNDEPCVLFQWGVGEVVSALAAAGLRVDALHEWPYTNGERPFDRMRAGADRRMYPPDDQPAIPLMYGVAASKQ